MTPSKLDGMRWEIGSDAGMLAISGPQPDEFPEGPDQEIEVMPVSEHERLRASMQQLYAYLWDGTPDHDDLKMMMLITSAALRGEQT